MPLEQSSITNLVLPGKGRSVREVEILGEALSGILLSPSAVSEKHRKESSGGVSGLDLAAQIPRAQKVAFLHVWTIGSSPQKYCLTAIRKGVSLEELLLSVTHIK